MTEILIVDDEPDIRLLVEAILRDEGFEARSAGNSDEAIAAYRARRPALVILDVWLQGSKLDGIGILDVLHGKRRIPVGVFEDRFPPINLPEIPEEELPAAGAPKKLLG